MNKNTFPISQFFNANTIDRPQKKAANISNFLNLNEDTTTKQGVTLDLNNSHIEINSHLFRQIREEVGDDKFNAIFKDVSIISINDQEIIFKTNSLIQKLYIEENYLNLLTSKLSLLNLQNKKIVFTQSPTILSPTTNKQNTFSFKLKGPENRFENPLNEAKVSNLYKSPFNDIIISGFNKLVTSSLKSICKKPGKQGKYPFIYIYGESGVGKTQLMDATAKEIVHNFPNLKVLKISSRIFVRDVMNSYRNNKLENFNHKYNENIDVLLIDEIQEFKNKEGSQNKFYHLFNDLFYKGKQIIICSDHNPKSLEGFSDKLKSRLQWGLIVKIDKPDFDTRVKILKDKSSSMDLFLNDEVVNFLASYYKDSVRELEGAILSLSAYTEIMNVEIDLELAKDQLSIQQTDKLISIEQIAEKTAAYFNLSLRDLLSKSRKKEQVIARHVAWYLTREILNINLIDIAHFYNRKEHSSVLHGVNKISFNLKSDSNLSKIIFLIKTSL